MSRLRDKLARLRPGVGGSDAARPDGSDSASASQGAAACSESVDLEALGDRLRSLVRAPGRRGEATAGGDETRWTLPFVRQRGQPLESHCRQEGRALGQRMGGVPLGAALAADAELLALLALTPELASCDVAGALYLDIETTGLGGAGAVAFLVGLAWVDLQEQRIVLEQHFLRELGEEPSMLEQVAERVRQAAFVVSYNGKSFDLPLLRSRLIMSRLAPLPERPQLDLLHLVRRVHRNRSWPKSLVSAERHVLRFHRGPDVAGEEVAQRYLHFLRSGHEEGLQDVVTHNEFDVLSMVAMLGLYGESLVRLGGDDLADVARVMRRAGAIDRAAQVVARAVEERQSPYGLRARAEIAKARGDKQQALADYEQLAAEVDDALVRLELAKLYEHYLRAPAAALEVTELGTAERPEAQERRRSRLQRRIEQGSKPRGKRR